MTFTTQHRVRYLTIAAAMLAAASPAAAAVDPERNATTPVGSHWWVGKSESQLRQAAKDRGERVISINVDDPASGSLTAALVRNTGPYQRDGDFFVNKTGDQVVALTKGKKRRLIDLEAYQPSPGAATRFAGVTVPNTGASNKGWRWNYDLTQNGVTADLEKHKLRLTDLSTYVRGGQRRYAYVGIKNVGADKLKWWWYPGASAKAVRDKLATNHARLIDVERPSKGKLTVVMVRTQGQFSLGATGYTAGDLNRLIASQGVRITDIERYGDRFAAVTIDNVDAETGRLRSILRASPWKDAYFGVMAKKVGGPTYVRLADKALFQPYSVLKLLPHLYVMDRYDQVFDGNPGFLLGTVAFETDKTHKLDPSDPLYGQPVSDTPWCPADPPANEQTWTTTLAQTLSLALMHSFGPAHEALLNKYGPKKITARVQQLGLSHTVLYYGCKHSGQKDWYSNRSTLSELGYLFEAVETKKFFPNHWQLVRDQFYGLMGSGDKNLWVKPVVIDEAAKQGKSGSVAAFMSATEIKGKGGGVNFPQSDGTWSGGRSFSYRLTLPYRYGAAVMPRSFVGGWFVNDIKMPCNEEDATDPTASAKCKVFGVAMQTTYAAMIGEAQRLAIREALSTWPKTPSPPPPVRPADKPDLVIVPIAGAPPVIRNVGAVAAGAFRLSVRDTPTARPVLHSFTGLAAGAQVTTDVLCQPRRAFVVDADNEIAERDETNNAFTCP